MEKQILQAKNVCQLTWMTRLGGDLWYNWKLTGKLRCLVIRQNSLICLSGKYVCCLEV